MMVAVKVLSAVGVMCLLLSLAACSSAPGNDVAVSEVAGSFSTALAADDGTAACHLLADSTRAALEKQSGLDCADAMGSVGLPPAGAVRSIAAYGRAAQVVLESDVIFLTLAPSGWRVTAAGCTPRPPRPYDCDLKGD